MFPQIWMDGKKKVHFDVNAKRDTLFEACDVIKRDTCKLPIYEFPTSFDSSSVEGPS